MRTYHWDSGGLGMDRHRKYLLKIGSGSTPRGSNYSSKGIPFFRSQNIYNNGLVYEDIKFISEDIHQTMIGTEVCLMIYF